ncbi:oxidoreductase [Alicyclobacillus sp. ALC3]|uniref:oxidoreductase n=1 Tax=Alicyclobacillus sp. ALC3 TaxID=2796143 RepID=UPI0023783034|nr:oxidoreductase [Alicyclobacillus sp. ALC3]WDL96136.1 SDR family NAD(P)-dependent oxidoreductase [Alicyclobacillus sp. ALC3]
MAEGWTTRSLSDQSGRRILVTGANSGIGFEAARALAAKGAEVILAVRNIERGETARKTILTEYPQAQVQVMSLDLSNQARVRSFASEFTARYDRLDVLINNAGVMAPPYTRTEDGFELQFGTNHLGHFALTGLILPTLQNVSGSRVVVVSSLAHQGGQIYFDNLDGNKGYKRWAFYSQSKLANLLFMRELERRLRAAGAQTIAAACHPGFASTQLVKNGMGGFTAWLSKPFGQSAEAGALPTLFVATDKSIHGGEYIGPTGWRGMRGAPGPSPSTSVSNDMKLAGRLWKVSEQMTGVTYASLSTS